MNAYITAQGDLIVTNSTAKKSIEAGNLDKVRVPWFKLSKRGTLWQLEEFDREEVRIVAQSGTAQKLLVPLVRRSEPISVHIVSVVKEWLDTQKSLSG